MSGGMFLIQGDKLIEMSEQNYDTEAQLQKWLAQWPNLLAGDQINNAIPRKWLLISREFGIPDRTDGSDRWFLDHLFMDQDAIPTLIEVKRSSDTRSRREVVAQMLDYAANGVAFSSADRMQSLYEVRCQKEGLDMEDELFSAFGADTDIADFWQQAKNNLESGTIRMIFVADTISIELLRIVEFLNKQMRPAEVFAFEIKKFGGEGVTTLIPRILGQSAEAQTKKKGMAPTSEPCNEASFTKALETKANEKEIAVCKVLFEWAVAQGLELSGGTGDKEIILFLKVHIDGINDVIPFSLITYMNPNATSAIRIRFKDTQKHSPLFDQAWKQETVLRLNKIIGKNFPLNQSDKERCSIKMADLADSEIRNAVLDVLNGVLATLRKDSSSTT